MPIVESSYECSNLFKNGHVQTIFPWLFRSAPTAHIGKKNIIDTPDGEKLSSLIFRAESKKKLVIVTHGLEGNGEDKTILHLSQNLCDQNYNVVTWTMRSCDNDITHTKKFYTGSDYCDLQTVLNHYESEFQEIYLVGISLGGSITCNYLGREADRIHPKVKGGFLISTPLDLEESSKALESNLSKYIYQQFFVRTMKKKVLKKAKHLNFPIDLKAIKSARLISDFDEHIIVPMYGFENGKDYRRKASSLPYLLDITVPLYILNAQNDPFLDEKSYPREIADKSDTIFLETPLSGGHVGFIPKSVKDPYWFETRLVQFLEGQF